MKLIIRTFLVIMAFVCFGVSEMYAVQDVVVNVTGITGHDGGNWTTTVGHLTDMINASDPTIISTSPVATPGMTLVDPADPSTWIWSSGSYQQTWHANSILDSGTSANGKIGWVVLDFGEVVDRLANLYMWASSTGQTGGGTEQVRDYNLYYSSGVGITALPSMPNSTSTTGDYDFSVGDWTLSGSNTLGSADGAVSNTNSLGLVSARYIGIEVMTIGGVDNRCAIAQVEVTRTLPPSGSQITLR